jgi:hypothetical protein
MRRKLAKNSDDTTRFNVYADKETTRKLAEIQATFKALYPNVPSLSICFTKSLSEMYERIKNEPGALDELYKDFTSMGYEKHKEAMREAVLEHKDELVAAVKRVKANIIRYDEWEKEQATEAAKEGQGAI